MKVVRKIAILGAQGSGKSWLAARLGATLAGDDVLEWVQPLAGISGVDWVLLMGLDLVTVDPLMHEAQRQNSVDQDQALREELARLGQSFHVIYGCGDTRLQQALSAITRQSTMDSIAGYAISARPEGPSTLRNSENWRWPCEKCSDPDCEHQLFSRLLQTAGRSL